MKTTYFSIKRDNKYPFFCQACLTGKPLSERSGKDARYCSDCQALIEGDYAVTAELTNRKSKYMPVAPLHQDTPKQKEVLLHTKSGNAHEYQNLPQTPTINLGGRPRKDIPIDLIHTLSKEGFSIKKIVRELREHKLSAMTVSRVLSGQRSS